MATNLGMTPNINQIYQETFGRPAEQGGVDYWSSMAAQNPGMDLQAAIRSGAQQADVIARNDIAAGGVDTSTTWGNGATLNAATLQYDDVNNTWGKVQPQGGWQRPNTPQVDTAYKKNPFLDEMAAGITSQMNDNWTRNLAPSIRSGAMAAGGFGGSRQGVVEANGLNDMNRSLGQNLTNLYGTDYTQAQNRNLQQQSINNNYDLGLRSSDLGFAGLDANIAQNNFGNQLNSAQFGLNAFNTMGNYNNQATNAATTVQNQPLNYFNSASDKTNSMANGYGSQTSSQNNPGNPMLGALGGAQLGSQMYNQFMAPSQISPSNQANFESFLGGSNYFGTGV